MAHDSLNSRDREIRVADLLSKSDCRPSPVSNSGPAIQISLRKVSLNDSPPPEYTALSYVWGDPKDTIPILVDGVEFAATKNLVSALRELQHDEEIVTLWVDAVCINQSDNDEKSWQIQLMKQIFEASAGTVVRLGDEAEGSDEIMKMIADFAARPDFQAAIAGSVSGTRTAEVTDEGQQVCLMMINDPSIPTDFSHPVFLPTQTSLMALLNRQYWFRVWCLQEISVCRNTLVACGNDGCRINVDSFAKFIYYYIRLMESLEDMITEGSDMLDMIRTGPPYPPTNLAKRFTGAARMLRKRKIYRRAQEQAEQGMQKGGNGGGMIDDNGTQSLDLVLLLISAYTRGNTVVSMRSTDPRDMVYGLLNLAHDVEELGIVPDYDKTCEQVFLETWSALIRKHGASFLVWAVLSGIPKAQVIINGPSVVLPSWVPDWRQPRRYHALYQYKFFLTCGLEHQDTQWVHTDDPYTIALKGVLVDVVRTVGTVPNRKHFEQNKVFSWRVFVEEVTRREEIARFLEESSASSVPVYPSPEALHAARWRIPLCDLEVMQDGASLRRATPAFEERFDSTVAIFESYANDSGVDFVEGSAQWSMTLSQHMSRAVPYISVAISVPYPRPFLTSRGWVGRGPAGMREGDINVILWGSHMPLVLRPCGDGGEEKYQLVGSAYVHGLMDGEFIRDEVVREEKVFYLV